jgi:hypothetical protein
MDEGGDPVATAVCNVASVFFGLCEYPKRRGSHFPNASSPLETCDYFRLIIFSLACHTDLELIILDCVTRFLLCGGLR